MEMTDPNDYRDPTSAALDPWRSAFPQAIDAATVDVVAARLAEIATLRTGDTPATITP